MLTLLFRPWLIVSSIIQDNNITHPGQSDRAETSCVCNHESAGVIVSSLPPACSPTDSHDTHNDMNHDIHNGDEPCVTE